MTLLTNAGIGHELFQLPAAMPHEPSAEDELFVRKTEYQYERFSSTFGRIWPLDA